MAQYGNSSRHAPHSARLVESGHDFVATEFWTNLTEAADGLRSVLDNDESAEVNGTDEPAPMALRLEFKWHSRPRSTHV